MAKKRAIKIGEQPAYPTDEEAKDYARQHKEYVEGGVNCREAYGRFQPSQSIEVLTTWGCNNIFMVFAYPPAGFIIEAPEDVLALQTFEGWILEYRPDGDFFNTLVKASRDGIPFFRAEHARHTR